MSFGRVCRRGAIGLAAFVATAALADARPTGRAPAATIQLPPPASRLLEILADTPYLLPPLPEKSARLAFVTGTVQPGVMGIPDTGPALGSDLSIDRGRALDTSRTPDYWMLIADAAGRRIVYWAPVFVSRALRAEWHDPGAPTMQGRSVRRLAPTYAVRVPFESRGRIYVVEARRGRALVTPAVVASGAFEATP